FDQGIRTPDGECAICEYARRTGEWVALLHRRGTTRRTHCMRCHRTFRASEVHCVRCQRTFSTHSAANAHDGPAESSRGPATCRDAATYRDTAGRLRFKARETADGVAWVRDD